MRLYMDWENDGVDAPGYDVLMCLLLSVRIEEPWLQAAAKDQKGNVASLPAEYEIIQFRSLDIYNCIYRFLQPETSTCPSTTDFSSPPSLRYFKHRHVLLWCYSGMQKNEQL